MVILRLGSVEKYRQTGETLRFEKIPFGHYGIEIQAAGLLTRRKPVVIDRPEVHLWFGLFVSPLEGVGLAEVAGIIAPHESNPKALWVRLISLYSGDSLEDQVAPFGEFRFVDVYPGRYILVVFNKEKLIETQPVDISAGKLRLNLNLSK